MSKGIAALTALALAVLPAMAQGQEIGASFRVFDRALQPSLVEEPDADATFVASAPQGWALGVSRGAGGGAGSRYAPALLSDRTRKVPLIDALPGLERGRARALPLLGDAPDGPITVTVLFAPL